MSKFFIDKECVNVDNITITGPDVEHIGRVLRMRVGDDIVICDKEGTDYNCTIEEIKKDRVICKILSSCRCEGEPRVKLTLFQCIPKAGKMDSIIQKCVELGAWRIVPVLSKRCVAKAEKIERWQKIAAEAAKQCKRGIIPEVAPAVSFEEAVDIISSCDVKIIPYENAKTGTINELNFENVSSFGVMIGPEGGFEEQEVEKAAGAGVIPVTLGKRILRTETAGAAVTAIVMNALGEMC